MLLSLGVLNFAACPNFTQFDRATYTTLKVSHDDLTKAVQLYQQTPELQKPEVANVLRSWDKLQNDAVNAFHGYLEIEIAIAATKKPSSDQQTQLATMQQAVVKALADLDAILVSASPFFQSAQHAHSQVAPKK